MAVWTSVASKNVKTAARAVMVLVVIAVAHQQVVVMDLRHGVMAVVLASVVVIVRVVLVDPAALDKVKVVVPHAAMDRLEHAPAPVARVVAEIVISAAAHVALVIVAAMTARSVIGWRCREIFRS